MIHRSFIPVSRHGARLLASVAFLVSGGPVLAQAVLPSAPSVAAGAAVVSAPTATSVLVTQSSRNAIINWGAFSIGAGQSVRFENGGGATLNRVTGPLPSQIDGSLSATGSVFLVNPNGIVIGPTGQIVTGGSFIASTHDVRDSEFMSGGAMTFRGTSTASVINYGSIGALGGDVALIARKVENAGTITAPNGTAALAAGYEVLVRDGALSDGKFVVKVGGADTEAKTRGVIKAAEVELKANGGNVYALAGNTASVTKATGVATKGGRVFLTAGDGGTVRVTQTVSARKSNGAGGTIRVSGGKAAVSGTLDAKGDFGAGGRIVVTARDIALAAGAVLDASGTEGGVVLVGGDYQGGRDAAKKYLQEDVATAQTVSVAPGATIRADGSVGAGGRVVVWSDLATDFAGAISARGISAGGDAEVSGKAVLSYTGTADLTGAPGHFGTLLLDPYNLTISDDPSSGLDGFNANADDSVLNATTLANALATANVTVTTGSGGSQAGDITVATNVTWTGATTLTLSAYRNISVNGNLTGATGSAIALRADNTGTGTGTVTFGSGAFATASGGVSIYYNPTSYTSPTSYSSNAGTSTTVTGYMLVNTLQNLQDVSTNVSGAYALGRNIDASATATWNSGAGFVPIGASSPTSATFTGIFDGLGQVISGLTINRTTSSTGLFGYTANATLRNIGLSGGSITGGTSTGALVGILSTGSTVSNSYSSATVTGTNAIGGLVGNVSGGKIADSYSTGNVTASGTPVGGLVGIAQSSTGSITRSYATGEVKTTTTGASANAGGLVGQLQTGATISQSYATGKVTATASGTGGLVGSATAVSITQSYATGAVSGGAAVGGLVGGGSSTLAVSKSYATGAVSGTTNVGGLVGSLTGTGTVSESYAVGAVSGTTNVGGLIGTLGSTASVSSSFFDSTTTGRTAGVGSNSSASGVTALTTAQFQDTAGFMTRASSWSFTSTWAPSSSGYYPQLYSVNPVIAVTGGETSSVYGNSTGTLTGYTGSSGGPSTYAFGPSGDSITLAGTSVSANSTANAGTATTDLNINASKASTGGVTYRVFIYGTGTTTVTARPLSVAANPQSMTYGDALPPLTYAITSGSLVNGDSLSGSLATLASSTANVGTYGITQGTLGNPNYAITYTGADVTISARPITVGANAQSMTYGNALPALTYAITSGSLVNGDSLSGSLATLASSSANVGTYGITQGTLGNSNYAITYTGADVTISARPITVTADAQSMIYGNAVPALTYSVTSGSLVNSDTLTGALATTASSTANVGAYAITQGSLAASSNYALTYDSADVTISARPITVAANAQSMTYGNAVPALTYSLTSGSLVNGDTLTGALTTLASSTANVGAYAITQGTLAASSNYALTYDSADVTISARPITVSANAQSMTYGNAVPALTYAITSGSLVNGDSLSGSLATLASSTANVGAYGITQGTLGNSNYAITYTGADVTISARPITVAANAQSMTYGDALPALTYSVTSGTLVNGDSLSGALATLASSTANVGTYGITQGTLGNSNYAITYTGADVTISARPITVTADAQSMIYGNAVPALTYSVTSGSLVNSDTLTGALATTASSTANVGIYGIAQGTLAASSNYALTYDSADVTISARPITVAANAQSMTYGNAVPALTYSLTSGSLVNGDTLTGALATLASSTANVGTYGIAQGTLAASSNYALTYDSADVTISARPITVAANAQSMTYGNAVPALTYSVTSGSLVNGDTLTGALATLASSTANVGAYAITQGTLAASSNYALTYDSADVTISARPITVAANAQSMTYGNAVPALTYSLTSGSLVNGDSLSGSLATLASSTANVGTYGITQGTLGNSNYAITYNSADVTISARPITVTADAQSMIYGNGLPALTYSLTSGTLVNGDTLTGALATTASSTANVGAYAITQGTLAASSNYALTYDSADVTISARPITVSANAQSMTYGNAVPTLTYSLTSGSLVNGDSLSGSLATLASSTANVGAYAITQGTLAASSNYALTYDSADVTISARPITVAANAQSMNYGNAVPALTYAITSGALVNGDSLSGSLATLASSTANVGAYGITQGTLGNSNYAITYNGADVTISARPITVAANAQSMTYGNALPALTYAITSGSLVNGDSLTGALATLASSTANVGTYGITQGTLGNSNYAITYTGADVTISARPITVAANAQSMTYGNAVPALTYAITSGSLVNGDSLSGSLATLASSTANVGTYAITQGTLGNPNYALTYDRATVTVLARPLTVAANAQTMTYGNAVPALSYTLTSGTLVNGDTLTGALATLASSSANVGGYAITQGTLAASSNYALAYLGAELTVLARAITATAENQSRSEGAANPPLTYLVGGMGLVNGDAFSGSLSTPATPSSPAGLYPILQGSLSLSDNYALTYVPGELAVLPVATPFVPVENAVAGNAAIVIPPSLLISTSLLVPQPATDQWSVTIQTDSLAAISTQGTTDSSDGSAKSSDSSCAGGGSSCTDRPHSDNRNFGRWLTFRAQ